MNQPFPFGNTGALSTTLTVYGGNLAAWTGTEALVQKLVPAAGVFSNFKVNLNGAPSAGKSYTFTVRKNGVDTGIVVAISGTATTGEDVTNTATFAAGDLLSISSVPSGTPTARVVSSGYLQFAPTTSNRYVTIAGSDDAAALLQYNAISGGRAAWNTTENIVYNIIPHVVTLKEFHVKTTAAPGAGKSWTFTIFLNGVQQSAADLVIADTAISNSVTGLSIALAVHDRVSVRYSANSGTPAAPTLYWGVVMQPDKDGESLIATTGGASFSPTGKEWNGFDDGNSNFTAIQSTESNLSDPPTGAQNVILKKLYVRVASAPGAGSRTYGIAGLAAGETMSAVITGAGVLTGQDTTNTKTLTAGGTDSYAIASTPLNLDIASGANQVSIVALIGIIPLSVVASDANRNWDTPYQDLMITYTEAAQDPALSVGGTATGHTINLNGTPQTTTYRSGSGTAIWVVRIPALVKNGDTLTYDYSQAAGATVGVAAGNEIEEATAFAVTNSLTKRIRFVLKDKDGAAVTVAIKYALLEDANGVASDSTWMSRTDKGTTTPDGSGNVDVEYTGTVAVADTCYVAVIQPNVTPVQSMIWPDTVV